MITPKQRAFLKGMGNSLEPVFQIGKGGVNDAQVAQIDDYLRVHELVKIKVLDNSLYSSKEASIEIAEKIGAEVVQVIGAKAILYKANPKDPVIKLK
ncbi:MAG: YhbY family RNA-binding protein [Clostridiales bacterium]|nr:YhbY family RNA-binding protein [Clostridiales bacterium]